MVRKEIKNKLDFQENFRLFDREETKDDLDIFLEELFFPIYKRSDNTTGIITNNRSLIRANVDKPDNLKVILKYVSNIDEIYYCNDELYFALVQKDEETVKEVVSKDAEDFFRKILQSASRKGASDIHVSWEENGVRIKFRIDGISITQGSLISFDLGEAFKNLCVVKANESEYEKNEVAGKFKMLIDQKVKEYRLSIAPTAKGYAIVIRQASVIDMTNGVDKWGYTPKAVEMIRKSMTNHFGMVLVTGPTGSGKSTLLYSLVVEEKNKNKVIKTVEDPVEIEVNGVDQVQVNTKGDIKSHLTFAKAIKVFLRQDPDVIVVGEIRDLEVATTAFTAAKTGHLCISTLHTNDVDSTVSRLFDLGVQQLDLEDSLRCVVSQRLVPALCDNCKIKVEQDGNVFYERNKDGCQVCLGSKVSGYKGRVPIVEIALMDNTRYNFKKENFLAYYSLEENILDLIETGKIDIVEANKHIQLEDLKTINRRKEIINIWNKIISNNENEEYLIPYYQPIVDKNKIIVAYEIFGRLKNLSGGMYNPGQYIPILKEMKLYDMATNYLFNKCFENNKMYGLNFFFNVDHSNLSNKDVVGNIVKKVNDMMSASMSNFILETNYDYESFIEDVVTARKNDISISLDNFDGSAQAVQKIKKHNIKIDYVKTYRDFIIGFSNDELWVDHYMNMLKELDTKIVVTNIETIEIFEKLKNKYGHMIDYYQGYFFGKPIKDLEVL